MSLGDLSAALFRERELLEDFLYKLEVEQLIVTSGKTHYLPRATAEVTTVTDRINTDELARAVEAEAACAELGLESGASLQEIAAAAPAPWDELFAQHHEALCSLIAQISAVARGNRELLLSRNRFAQETLLSMRDEPQTYSPTGAKAAPTGSSRLIDQTF